MPQTVPQFKNALQMTEMFPELNNAQMAEMFPELNNAQMAEMLPELKASLHRSDS
jgi:hypothetical protein